LIGQKHRADGSTYSFIASVADPWAEILERITYLITDVEINEFVRCQYIG